MATVEQGKRLVSNFVLVGVHPVLPVLTPQEYAPVPAHQLLDLLATARA